MFYFIILSWVGKKWLALTMQRYRKFGVIVNGNGTMITEIKQPRFFLGEKDWGLAGWKDGGGEP